jgi:hypothetical protein
MKTKVTGRRLLAWTAAFGLAWIGLTWSAAVLENPAVAARQAAASLGGWSPEQLHIEKARFLFLGLYASAETSIVARSSAGVHDVQIELGYVPLRGWSVVSSTMSPARSNGVHP